MQLSCSYSAVPLTSRTVGLKEQQVREERKWRGEDMSLSKGGEFLPNPDS